VDGVGRALDAVLADPAADPHERGLEDHPAEVSALEPAADWRGVVPRREHALEQELLPLVEGPGPALRPRVAGGEHLADVRPVVLRVEGGRRGGCAREDLERRARGVEVRVPAALVVEGDVVAGAYAERARRTVGGDRVRVDV